MKNNYQQGQILLIVLAILTVVTTVSMGLASQIINSRQEAKLMEISTKAKAVSESTSEKVLIDDLTFLPTGVGITKSPELTLGLGLEKSITKDVPVVYYLKEYEYDTGDFVIGGVTISNPTLCLSADVQAVEVSIINKPTDFERNYKLIADPSESIPGSENFDPIPCTDGNFPKKILVDLAGLNNPHLLTVRMISTNSTSITPNSKVKLLFGDTNSISQGRLVTTTTTTGGITQSEVVFQEYPQLLPMLLMTVF